MPRPKIPLPKDVVALFEGARDEGINSLTIRFVDGMEIEMSSLAQRVEKTALEEWKGRTHGAS